MGGNQKNHFFCLSKKTQKASLDLLALRRSRHPLPVVELGHVHCAAPREPAAHAVTALLCLDSNSIDFKTSQAREAPKLAMTWFKNCLNHGPKNGPKMVQKLAQKAAIRSSKTNLPSFLFPPPPCRRGRA